MSEWVDYFWAVRWDRTGRGLFRQEVLPHPAVNVVIERNRSGIFGPTTGKYVRVLEGKGWAFATKFKPSGFSAFLRAPLRMLADRHLSLTELWPNDGAQLEQRLLGLGEDLARQAAVESFLCAHASEPDAAARLVAAIIAAVSADRSLIRVEQLADYFGLSTRSLQRLFAHYVGVHPKWVIQRYRLQEAAERLASSVPADWASLACDLGYFDQAHFSRDFKALIGVSPATYARLAATPS